MDSKEIHGYMILNYRETIMREFVDILFANNWELEEPGRFVKSDRTINMNKDGQYLCTFHWNNSVAYINYAESPLNRSVNDTLSWYFIIS